MSVSLKAKIIFSHTCGYPDSISQGAGADVAVAEGASDLTSVNQSASQARRRLRSRSRLGKSSADSEVEETHHCADEGDEGLHGVRSEGEVLKGGKVEKLRVAVRENVTLISTAVK